MLKKLTNGTLVFDDKVLTVNYMDREIKCKVTNLHKSDSGLYTGFIWRYKGGDLKCYSIMWNRRTYPVPVVKEKGRVIADLTKREALQQFIIALFNQNSDYFNATVQEEDAAKEAAITDNNDSKADDYAVDDDYVVDFDKFTNNIVF
jgi:hypothetical protein